MTDVRRGREGRRHERSGEEKERAGRCLSFAFPPLLRVAPAIEISDEPKDCAVFAGGEIYLRCKTYSPSHKEVAFQWFKHLSGTCMLES